MQKIKNRKNYMNIHPTTPGKTKVSVYRAIYRYSIPMYSYNIAKYSYIIGIFSYDIAIYWYIIPIYSSTKLTSSFPGGL